MKNSSKSFGASLIELIVAVTVFSLVAAQCIQLFVEATRLSRESSDLSRAVFAVESVAEIFTATGDISRMPELLSPEVVVDGDSFVVYYDESGAPAPPTKETAYVLVGKLVEHEGISACDISVSDVDGTDIFSVRIAGREARS